MNGIESERFVSGLCLGLILGVVVAIMLMSVFTPEEALTQETMNDICVHITNNPTAEGEIVNWNWRNRGDLKCVIPSYDHTQRIIVERNNE